MHTNIPIYQTFVRLPPAFFFLKKHTPAHQEVSHQFQEAIGSWTETGHNPETPGHKRHLQLLAASLVGELYHRNLQIRPPGLPSYPC